MPLLLILIHYVVGAGILAYAALHLVTGKGYAVTPASFRSRSPRVRRLVSASLLPMGLGIVAAPTLFQLHVSLFDTYMVTAVLEAIAVGAITASRKMA